MLKSIDRYSWNPEAGAYYSSLTLDGKPIAPESGQESPFLKAWVSGYGVSSILTVGRIAAYFARFEKDGQFLEMAKRTVQITRKEPLPDHFVAENMADAIHLSLDLYDLTGEKAYLAEARKYADLSIARLWKNGLFVRQTNDPYYEAKLGVGDLVAGLLRLHLTLHPEETKGRKYDWSI